jgi:hypothetical protein
VTENNFKYLQLSNVHIENHNFGAYYCRQLHEKGVAIFVHNSLYLSIIGIKHCDKQDIEICALKL